MMPILSSYLDYNQADLDTQLELFKKLNLSHLMIRKIDGIEFYNLDDALLNTYAKKLKGIKVIAIDSLLPSFNMEAMDELAQYNENLNILVSKVKLFNPTYYIYTIPIFDETINDYKKVIEVIKEQIKIIRKHKLKILIKFSDGHTPKIYRYMIDALKYKYVEMMFDYVYLYKINEAEITAFRILRDHIGMLMMDDIDRLGAGRVIGSSNNLDVQDIAKRFIKRNFSGFVVLDSSLVELLLHASKPGWFSKLVSKKRKHEYKIYNDFIERYKVADTFRILRIQMAVLSLMFLNKKVALG